MQPPKFQHSNEVYVSREGQRNLEGPYLINRVVGSGKYTLSREDGTDVDNGAEFDEDSLTAAS